MNPIHQNLNEPKASRQAQISGQTEILEKSIIQLQGEIERLSDRLTPVIRPEPISMTKGGITATDDSEAMAPMADQLRALNDKINYIGNIVTALNGRLEL